MTTVENALNRHHLKTKHLRETWIREFELFLQSSFELCLNFSSNKVQTVRRTLNFFESCKKEKRFGIYSIFVKYSNFSTKKQTFLEVQVRVTTMHVERAS
jgi:hypothetical protein